MGVIFRLRLGGPPGQRRHQGPDVRNGEEAHEHYVSEVAGELWDRMDMERLSS